METRWNGGRGGGEGWGGVNATGGRGGGRESPGRVFSLECILSPVFLFPRRRSVCKQRGSKHIVLVCPAPAASATAASTASAVAIHRSGSAVNLPRSLDLQPPDYYCYLSLFTRRCGHFDCYRWGPTVFTGLRGAPLSLSFSSYRLILAAPSSRLSYSGA